MKDLPTHIALNMTSACNMDCSYCYMDKLNSGKRMSNQVLDGVIEMINKTDDSQRFQVSFFGGEPTLASRSIEYFIDNANLDKVEGFSLTTNGTNIDVVNHVARRGAEMSNGRIKTKVLVSNKDVRAPHQDLDLSVVDNSFRYIIGVDTIHEIDESLVTDLLESEFIQVDFRFDYYANWEDVDQVQVNRVIEMLRTFQNTTNRLKFQPPKILEARVGKKCPAPHMSIDTNGDLMPCHRMFNSTRGVGMAVGNILEDMNGAVAKLAQFHTEVHFSTGCVGFTENFGQDSDIHVLNLGTVEYEKQSEPMTDGHLVAAIANERDCR